MTKEEAKREILFAKRDVMADSWIDKAYDVAIKALSEPQPEIIRCKDCKQFRRWIDTDICFCDITESERSDDDFCSRAEREQE